MANITRSALDALSSTNFPDNTSQLISPADLRAWLESGIDSFLTQKDTNTLENALYEAQGSALAASASVNLSTATGNYLHITGAATINSFGTCSAGSRFILVFDGICTLTDSATLILPGGSDITTAAGDCAMLVSEGSGNWKMVAFFPIAGGGGGGDITAVTAGTGLSGGGTSGAVTLNLANTAVTPNSYTNANITVDQQGRITAASSGTPGGVTSVSVTSPITDTGTLTVPNIGIQNADADGSTKGAAAFATNDFNAASGVISLDYANGQKASGSQDGFLSQGDWTTFNNKGNGTVFSIATSSPITGGTITGSGTIGLGTVGFANGGTGQTTQQTALNALAGSTTSGQYLRGNGTNVQMSAIQAGDVPTLNQNTTGSAGSLSPGATIQTNLASTSASTFTGASNITPGVTGTLPIGNGGTGQTSANAAINALLPSQSTFAGRYLTTDGTNTSWGSPTGSGTVASGTTNRLAYYTAATTVSSANTGSGIGIDATNNRIGLGVSSPAARVDVAAGVAANGQLLLTPSALSGALTGTTDGTIWYDTTSNNSSLYLRKLYAAATSVLTKFITLDRNPDLAGGTSGLVQADANGTLSKGADLTALGIYAETVGSTIQNTTTATSLFNTVVGTTTLPANFFGVGKTITIFISGTYAQTSGSNTCTIALTIGGVAMGSIVLSHGNTLSATYFDAQFTLTCRTAGATGTIQYQGKGVLNSPTPSFYFQSSTTSGSINTTTTNAIAITGTWSAANAANILVTGIHYANYIN